MESSAHTDLSDFNQDTVREVLPNVQDSTESSGYIGEDDVTAVDEIEYDIVPKHQPSVALNTVIIRHPKCIFITAAVQLCISLQLEIFAVICHFYDGCPYKSALWISAVFIANAVIGLTMVKYQPKRFMVNTYAASTFLSLLLGIVLFCITAWLLDSQEKAVRGHGWRQPLWSTELNKLVENTKIAMYTLHMVFTPAHVMCTIVSSVLCVLNLNTPEEEMHRAYYVSKSPVGHQTVLVPMKMHTGVNVAENAKESDRLLVETDGPLQPIFNKGTQTILPKDRRQR